MVNKNTQELLRLVKENPGLPIVPLVDYEVVGDGWGSWVGAFCSCYVGGYALYGDRYYDDISSLEEAYWDNHCDEYDGEEWTDEKINADIKLHTKDLWNEAIIVYISTL